MKSRHKVNTENHSGDQLSWSRSQGAIGWQEPAVVVHLHLIGVSRIHHPTMTQHTFSSNLQRTFWWIGGGWIWNSSRERNSWWLSLRGPPYFVVFTSTMLSKWRTKKSPLMFPVVGEEKQSFWNMPRIFSVAKDYCPWERILSDSYLTWGRAISEPRFL